MNTTANIFTVVGLAVYALCIFGAWNRSKLPAKHTFRGALVDISIVIGAVYSSTLGWAAYLWIWIIALPENALGTDEFWFRATTTAVTIAVGAMLPFGILMFRSTKGN